MLADIAASHLFMQALGRPGRWYRLHRLIADILRARPGGRRERRDLHRRAAEWFRRNDMPLDAIRSAIAGESGRWPPTARDLHARAGHGRSWPGARTGAGGDPQHSAGRARRARRRARRRPRRVRFRHRGRSARRRSAGCGRQASPRRASRARTLSDLTTGGLARIAGDWEATVACYQRVPVEPCAGRIGDGRCREWCRSS